MKPNPRLASIDCFRGFAVIKVALSSHLFTMDARHASDGHLAFPDLAAPWFIFVIGLTYGASLRLRWPRDGLAHTFRLFARRIVILFAIGFIGIFIQTSARRNENGIYWGVLQTIAVTITLTFPFLLLPTLARVLTGEKPSGALSTALRFHRPAGVAADPRLARACAILADRCAVLCIDRRADRRRIHDGATRMDHLDMT